VGKWLHAASLLWLWTRDERLREKIDRVAEGLMATREEDGYLGTYVKEKRFGLYRGADWDVWIHKYCLIGLLSYWGISGDDNALETCRRAGDLLCRVFPAQRSIIAAGTHVGMAATSILEPIVLLYRATGEKRYLDFARYIVKSWDEPNGPHVLSAMLREKTVLAVGNRKAYEMLSNYVGLCELHRATGEEEYLKAAELAWEDVRKKRLYITGSASSYEHFQPDGQFPNDEAHRIQETCVTVTWMQLNWQLLRITGEEKYAEALEQTTFNELLGAQKPDGSGFGYYVPLIGRKPFSPDYPGTEGMDCCNSSGPRGLGLILTVLAAEKADGLMINTFAPAVFAVKEDGVPTAVRIESDFPASGRGRIQVNPMEPVTFTLYLRIPRWAEKREVKLGGRIFNAKPGTYLALERKWRSGDTIEFDFPFRIEVHKGRGTNKGLVAVTAGPLVMAFDGRDNPSVRAVALVSPKGDTPGECGFAWVPSIPPQSWVKERFLKGEFVDLVRLFKKEKADFTGLLRPYFDAGSWNSTYAVWLKAPGSALKYDMADLFLFGKESYSRKGNVEGKIADGDPSTFRVTFDGTFQKEAWFAVEIEKPVRISKAVYVAGRCFHDGGWFDTTKGKPRFEIKKTPDGSWIPVAAFRDYPDTTRDKPGKVHEGLRVSVSFPPIEAVAIRVTGTPASGDNPRQAFASCAELMAFEK